MTELNTLLEEITSKHIAAIHEKMESFIVENGCLPIVKTYLHENKLKTELIHPRKLYDK